MLNRLKVKSFHSPDHFFSGRFIDAGSSSFIIIKKFNLDGAY